MFSQQCIQIKNYTHIRLLLLCGLSVVLSACEFLNSATELTFAEGNVSEIAQEMLYPQLDQLTTLQDEENPTPGLPMSLDRSTMAHLVGALSAQGECNKINDLSPEDREANVRVAQFNLTACMEDDRCTEECADGFYGLKVTSFLETIVLNTEQTKEIRKLLSEDSEEAIVQIRLKFKELAFFQGEEEDREIVNRYIRDFEFLFGIPGEEPIQILDQNELEVIERSVYQEGGRGFERYEIPRDSAIAKKMIRQILTGQQVVIQITQNFRVFKPNLYEMDLTPAGIDQVIQPEIIIDAIDAAKSNL